MTATSAPLPLNRRAFAKTCVAAGAGALAAPRAGRALSGEPAARPNILFIYTDDQRYDALGIVQREQGDAGRFPWLRTPNLDRLAEGGLRFRQAFVVNSVCSPSRSCTLTGTYSHVTGVKDNSTSLPEHNVTIGEMMGEAGYDTGYFGKWHMGKQTTRPGFDTWASQIGHGWFKDCHLNVNGSTVETKGWLDDVVTDYALSFMRERRDRPFFAVIGYKAPHSPYDRHDGQTRDYDAVEARPVPNLGRLPGFVPGADTTRKPLDATELIRNYFRMLDNIDANIGRVLDALDREGLAANTLVVFTSDNGYFLGEHGVGDKRLAYEESIRVPLLARWPGRIPAGRTSEAMALNIDFAPTFLELAGAIAPDRLQGLSLTPVFADPAKELRACYFYEYFREKPEHLQPTVFAVRTRTQKLIHYPETPDRGELFDLAADPFELKNLIDDPARAALRARLERQMVAEAERLKLPVETLNLNPRKEPT
jgi:arylsulfatase A-like enzyme